MNRADIERAPDAARPGVAWFAKVADGPLLITEQIFPRAASPDAAAQVNAIIDGLATLLGQAGGDLRRVVRLHFYVAEDAVTSAVYAALATRIRDAPSAVTIVRSELARDVQVAVDAVAAITRGGTRIEKIGTAAVLPTGGKAFISGQLAGLADADAAAVGSCARERWGPPSRPVPLGRVRQVRQEVGAPAAPAAADNPAAPQPAKRGA